MPVHRFAAPASDPAFPGRRGVRDAIRLATERLAGALFGLRRVLLDQPFFTSTVLPAIPRRARWALRSAYLKPADLMERAAGRNSDLIPPPSKMFVGSVDDFESSGRRLVQRLEALAGLTPESAGVAIRAGIRPAHP